MTARDRTKLCAAGYLIIRADNQPSPRIKKFVHDSTWVTIESFPTKAARDRTMTTMLMQAYIIED